MAPGLLKALLQMANYFRNWRKSDPQRGRKYLFWILVGGGTTLWILYLDGIAVPVDFAMFTGSLLLVEMFQVGTLLRIRMAYVSPPVLIQNDSVFITPTLIGAIGYGAFYLSMEIYQSIARGDTAEEDFTELLPEVPESDLAMIKPSLAHPLRELTRDPRHDAEYDI